MRVDLQRPRFTASALGCDQNRAAAAERIEQQASPARAILYRIRYQRYRLDICVHRQFFQPSRTHGVDASVVPDICPMASVLAELKIIDVGSGAGLPDKHQLVL